MHIIVKLFTETDSTVLTIVDGDSVKSDRAVAYVGVGVLHEAILKYHSFCPTSLWSDAYSSPVAVELGRGQLLVRHYHDNHDTKN